MSDNNTFKITAYERSSENQQKVNKLKAYARELGLKPYDILVAYKEENMHICERENIYGFILSLEWDREHGADINISTINPLDKENETFKYANTFVNKPQD